MDFWGLYGGPPTLGNYHIKWPYGVISGWMICDSCFVEIFEGLDLQTLDPKPRSRSAEARKSRPVITPGPGAQQCIGISQNWVPVKGVIGDMSGIYWDI